MANQEVSVLLVRYITEINEKINRFESSEEYKALQARCDEIDKLDDDELTDELREEYTKIEQRKEKIVDDIISETIKNLSQEEIIEIFSIISPEFIDSYLKPIVDFYTFEELMIVLLNKIEDENHQIHNKLLADEKFTTSMEYYYPFMEYLISGANSEDAFLTFLKKNSSTFSQSSNITPNIGLANLILYMINSDNYSNEFKMSVINDPELINYMDGECLRIILESDKISRDQKIKYLRQEKIFNKVSGFKLSTIISNLCSSYEELMTFLKEDIFLEKINIGQVLVNIELSGEQLKQIIYDDRILPKIDSYTLGVILSEVKMDFETRESLLYDERLYSKLDGHSTANIVSSKHLSTEERNKLLQDDRISVLLIYESRLYGSRIDEVLESENVPVEDKVEIIRNPKYISYISSEAIQKVMAAPNLPIEKANELLFDKRLFYRLINEWNEEYNSPEKFYGNKGPYKYDKYEYLKKLYEKNPYLARTISFDIFKDRILDLGFDFVEKISRYPELAELMAKEYNKSSSAEYLDNMLKAITNSKHMDKLDPNLFVSKIIEISIDNSYYEADSTKRRKLSIIRNVANLEPSQMTEENWRTITEIGLRDMSIYYNNISIGFFGSLVDKVDISLNILPDVENMEDLNNYTERRLKMCDDVFKESVEKKDLDGAKNAYLNKYFSINIQEAKEIVRMFSKSIDNFKNNPNYILQVKYIEQIQKILNIESLEVLSETYYDESLEPICFDEIIYIDQSLRQMFSKELSDSVYKVSGEPVYMEFNVEENREKVIKRVPVYEPGYDFKMLVNSTAAYGTMTLINDNYYDSWNMSDRKKNHGICCSLIANDNLGMAEIHDVLLGFDGWDPRAVTKSAPYDIYSANDSFDIQEGRPLTFLSPQAIIDNTRHTHNEQVLERRELRDGKTTQNIQPSYVIICSDMPDAIKQKAIKCSEELHIPIVYIDKEKIIHHEVEKIDKKIEALNNTSDIDRKLILIEQILLSHENNRSGLRVTNKELVEKYFPSSKIDEVFNKVISEIERRLVQTNDYEEYYRYSSKLIAILDKENDKFKVTMETVKRQNYIDIPVEDYKLRLIRNVDKDLGKRNHPKLIDIMQEYKEKKPDLPITQVFLSVDQNLISEQIDDIVRKGLYQEDGKNHNIGHIERVILLSQLIGRKELVDKNNRKDQRALELLTECAKYHDVGRKNDNHDRNHGRRSAEQIRDLLEEGKFTEEEIAIMQVAIEYHEEADDEHTFNRICKKYNIPEEKREYVKKIAQCLKDADALDRTRFNNPNSTLNIFMLRLPTSKELISVSKKLNSIYEEYDYKLFKRKCKKNKSKEETYRSEEELKEMMDELEETHVRSEENGKGQQY